MVGRTVDMTYPRNFRRRPARRCSRCSGLCRRNGVADIDLTVREGEIVGLCGLVGSGRTEVARAIFGADKVTSGEVRVFGRIHPGSPRSVRQARHGADPREPQDRGARVDPHRSATICCSPACRSLVSLRPDERALRRARPAHEIVKRLRIATPRCSSRSARSPAATSRRSSSANGSPPRRRLFIFDEPTRGIDIGAKAQIFALIDELVAAGAGVLMISSEQAEIVHVCDRAYVMRGGRIVGEIGRAEFSEENIAATGDAGCVKIPPGYPRTAASDPALPSAGAAGRRIRRFGSRIPVTANIANVRVQSAILMMLAMPMTLIIMSEGLDLSMGAVLTLTSLATAIVSLANGSMLAGLAAAIAVGVAFGTVNGWLVSVIGIPPFVATLGTLGMAQGLSLVVSDGQSVVGIPAQCVRDLFRHPSRHTRAHRAGAHRLFRL